MSYDISYLSLEESLVQRSDMSSNLLLLWLLFLFRSRGLFRKKAIHATSITGASSHPRGLAAARTLAIFTFTQYVFQKSI
jgi:hypothetical protein